MTEQMKYWVFLVAMDIKSVALMLQNPGKYQGCNYEKNNCFNCRISRFRMPYEHKSHPAKGN